MSSYFWIALGSALGGVGRFWISNVVAERAGDSFPWGTLLINITGCFVIGLFAALTGPEGRFLVGSNTKQFVMVGICGGYTTFSSFSLQTLNLARDGERLHASAYVGASVAGCLVAVWLGAALAAWVDR